MGHGLSWHGFQMKVFLVALLVVLFLSGAGLSIAYKTNQGFSETVDAFFEKKKEKEEETEDSNTGGKEEPGGSEQTASTTAAAGTPSLPKTASLSFRHDPSKPPVPQALGIELTKVPPNVEQAIVTRFPFTPYKSLNSVVNNWIDIPGHVFQHNLELQVRRDVTLTVAGDTAGEKVPIEVKAGGKVFAQRQEGSMLVVLQQQRSLYHAKVPLFQTNIKDVLTQKYNQLVNASFRLTQKYREDARKRYMAGLPAFAGGPSQSSTPTGTLASATPGRPAATPQPGTPAGSPNTAADPLYGPMPRTNSQGQVMSVATAISAKKFKDCELQFVNRWGVPSKTRWKGRPMWVVEVGYLVDSIFGRFPQEARAYVRNENVEGWEVIDD